MGLQFISILIPGDEKLTMEGNKYGLYMFEANHQCISKFTIENHDGTEDILERQVESARSRCDVYRYWFTVSKRYCQEKSIEKISWTFDHSINGGPFLRIVEQENICDLQYKPFSHNT